MTTRKTLYNASYRKTAVSFFRKESARNASCHPVITFVVFFGKVVWSLSGNEYRRLRHLLRRACFEWTVLTRRAPNRWLAVAYLLHYCRFHQQNSLKCQSSQWKAALAFLKTCLRDFCLLHVSHAIVSTSEFSGRGRLQCELDTSLASERSILGFFLSWQRGTEPLDGNISPPRFWFPCSWRQTLW